jgi:uncharacterized protein
MVGMKTAILDVYWWLCQYPWHIIFNLIVAVVFYALSLYVGLAGRLLNGERCFSILRRIIKHPVGSLILNLLAGYVCISILVVLLSVPILLNKGIIFNVLGYSFFFWFVLFPLHMTAVSMRGGMDIGWRVAILTCAIALLTAAGASLVYFPYHLKIRNVVMRTKHVQQPFRIVQLADIQAERYGKREAEVVYLVNSAQPDLVLISGDLFSRPLEYNQGGFMASIRMLEDIKVKHGILFVEGHHDQGASGTILKELKTGVRFLKDEWVDIDAPDAAVSVFGAALESGCAKLLERDKRGRFTICLSHGPVNPMFFPSGKCELALFGHTHAGQVYLPVVSRMLCGKYRHGEFLLNGMKLIVNAGVGTEGHLSPRIRWFTWPEIVVIDLVPDTDS